jgi:GAG-pre-integrase domain
MVHIGVQDIQVCKNELCASASMAQLTNNTHDSGTQLYHKAHKMCTAVNINQATQLYASLEALLGCLTTTWSFLCVATTYLIAPGTNVANTFRTFQANHSTPTPGLQYGTDSFLLVIDNHASASMTNTEDDFNGPTKTVDIKIKGIKGYLSTAKVGTVRWTLQDDQGRNHQFKISNEPDGTACHIYSNRLVLTWNHGKYCQTITLDKANVPIIRTSSSYNNYKNYISTLKEPPQPLAHTANFPMVDTSDMPLMDVTVPLESSYNNEVPHNVSPSNLLMLWHVRLGHIPFQQIQQMTANGNLPGELRKLSTPRCISCMFGKATKIPWRVKGMPNSHIKPTTHPGQCVTIEQMESSTPGLVAQMKEYQQLKGTNMLQSLLITTPDILMCTCTPISLQIKPWLQNMLLNSWRKEPVYKLNIIMRIMVDLLTMHSSKM